LLFAVEEVAIVALRAHKILGGRQVLVVVTDLAAMVAIDAEWLTSLVEDVG
jgi:hypothetical protein